MPVHKGPTHKGKDHPAGHPGNMMAEHHDAQHGGSKRAAPAKKKK